MLCVITLLHIFFLKQAIDEMLCKLNSEYRPVISAHYLDNTREQFMKRKILISFVGCYNTGKSTLLNSLLKARLACSTLLKCKMVYTKNTYPNPAILYYNTPHGYGALSVTK